MCLFVTVKGHFKVNIKINKADSEIENLKNMNVFVICPQPVIQRTGKDKEKMEKLAMQEKKLDSKKNLAYPLKKKA